MQGILTFFRNGWQAHGSPISLPSPSLADPGGHTIEPLNNTWEMMARFDSDHTANALNLMRRMWGVQVDPNSGFYTGTFWEFVNGDGLPTRGFDSLAHAWGAGPTQLRHLMSQAVHYGWSIAAAKLIGQPARVWRGRFAVPGTDRTSQSRGGRSSVKGMDNRAEIRDFLTSRRAKVTPEQVGLPVYGANRRVSGLRREEVAMLAGISVDYYTRLERGNLSGVSDTVLDALAQALRLDEAERMHLLDLARTANATATTRRGPRSQSGTVRPGVQRILDAMTMAPAYVRNGRFDVLGVNALGRAVFAPLFATTARTPNVARFMFLDPAAQSFYLDWEEQAGGAVALLRAEAGRDPYDRALTDLIGELSTRSDIFRSWWAAHNVRLHRTGVKRLHHPEVGDLILGYESMELTADPGLRLNAYSAEPGTPSYDALRLLASWTAPPQPERAHHGTDEQHRQH